MIGLDKIRFRDGDEVTPVTEENRDLVRLPTAVAQTVICILLCLLRGATENRTPENPHIRNRGRFPSALTSNSEYQLYVEDVDVSQSHNMDDAYYKNMIPDSGTILSKPLWRTVLRCSETDNSC